MSTCASSRGDVVPVGASAFSGRQLNEVGRLGLCARTASSDCLHSQENIYFVDYALVKGNPTRQGISDGGETIIVPNTCKAAVNLLQTHEWRKEVDKEIASFKQHNVYDFVTIKSVPMGHNVIGSRWVFKQKTDGTFKARLVVQGWGQVSGMECSGTFAPVYRIGSIQMAMAIATDHDTNISYN